LRNVQFFVNYPATSLCSDHGAFSALLIKTRDRGNLPMTNYGGIGCIRGRAISHITVR